MLLVADPSHANLIFGLQLANARQAGQQVSAKFDAVDSCDTISADAEPSHVIHMGEMSDVLM